MNRNDSTKRLPTRKAADPDCLTVTPEQAARIMDDVIGDCNDESVSQTVMVLRALANRNDDDRAEMLTVIESRLMIYTRAANDGLDSIVEAARIRTVKGGRS